MVSSQLLLPVVLVTFLHAGSFSAKADEPPPGSLTCASVLCAAGTTCVMVEENCSYHPCPEVPVCCPGGSSCSNVMCDPDEVCVLQQVQCIQPPCCPVPICKSNYSKIKI